MKILLIFPAVGDNVDLFSVPTIFSHLGRKLRGLGRSNMLPPLSLLMLAAVTPPGIEIHLVDERFEPVSLDEPADLVGISVVTKVAPRAYAMADRFLLRGTPVVLGGIHPSVMPSEAVEHATAVVIGEGETVWPELLYDLGRGRLKRFYSSRPGNFVDFPWPRREILPYPDRYLMTKVVMASRGCENSCTFCSCGAALGKRHRVRNVDDVIKEIRSVPGDVTYFPDDNLGWNPGFAKDLLQALISLRTNWLGSFNVSSLRDPELLDLMARSGCIGVDVGFESISPEIIRSVGKERTNDVNQYREVIEKTHAKGIPVYGNFILGLDGDTPDTFDHLVEFIKQTSLECPMVNILVPYPGSALHRQFRREGRLFHTDWDFYDDTSPCVVYQPKHLSAEELVDGYLHVVNSVNAPGSYLNRLWRSGTYRNTTGAFLGLCFSLGKRKAVSGGIDKTAKAIEKSRAHSALI